MVSTSPWAKASKARRTSSSLGWAMTPPFPRTGSGSLRLRHPTLNDPPVPVAPYLARPGLDDAHSSSFGLAGPGALADVAADPLGVVRPAGEQFGNRGLDFLRVGGAVVIQQDAMGGAVQQVAGVGQAAVLADRGQQQPSWWRWETRTPRRSCPTYEVRGP